jgi:hypothetical protein
MISVNVHIGRETLTNGNFIVLLLSINWTSISVSREIGHGEMDGDVTNCPMPIDTAATISNSSSGRGVG